MSTALWFVPVGFGNIVCANRVLCVMNPGTAPAKRRLKQAKESGGYIDMTLGRPLKSILLLDTGDVLGSALTCGTIHGRLQGEQPNNITAETETSL